MHTTHDNGGTEELNPADTGAHSNEVPTPEQQTETPDDLPHLAGRFDEDARPDHPPSDRA